MSTTLSKVKEYQKEKFPYFPILSTIITRIEEGEVEWARQILRSERDKLVDEPELEMMLWEVLGTENEKDVERKARAVQRSSGGRL